MWRTSNIILELEVFLYAYFIGTIWIHVNRVIHILYPLLCKTKSNI